MEIKKYQNQFAQLTIVQQLIGGIHVQNNLTINMGKTKVKENKIGNWLSAVSYMTTKSSEVFRFVKDNKNQVHGVNIESVSAVESLGRGRGVRGRDPGRGRGGVVRSEAKTEAVGAPMDRYSMKWTSKTPTDVFNQERCNRCALK